MPISARRSLRLVAHAEHAKLIEFYREHDIKGAINMTIQHLRATLADIEEAHQKNLL